MEIKYGCDQKYIRNLLTKATNLNLKTKNMKFLFKRYLEYEMEYGNNRSVEHVKKKATNFVDQNIEVLKNKEAKVSSDEEDKDGQEQ
jgi:rRNA biogenesis protein RRP5